MATTKKGAAKKRAKTSKAKRTPEGPTAKPGKVRDHGLKPGQVIERKFKGKDLRLQVTADGFTLEGTEYRSLTAAAKAATKYPSISGVQFWMPKPAAKAGA